MTEFAVERKRERRKGVIEEECLESDLESGAEEPDENEDYEELNEEEEESDEVSNQTKQWAHIHWIFSRTLRFQKFWVT